MFYMNAKNAKPEIYCKLELTESRGESSQAQRVFTDQPVFSTRFIEAGVYHSRQDPRCSLCKDAPETVQHIIAGCNTQAGSVFINRHSQVAGIVQRNICAEYGLEIPMSRWDTPLKVVENNIVKILLDFKFQTDKQLLDNQPDIVVVGRTEEGNL